MKNYDVVILTQKSFCKPINPDWYIKQVLQEDELVKKALKKKGLKVTRTYWDNPDFDFSTAKITLFRTVWDYFHRFEEFSKWLDNTKHKTTFINSPETIRWNIGKHYLKYLHEKGINIPNTYFIKRYDNRTLKNIFKYCNWKEAVLKPTVSGAGRHTYKLTAENVNLHEEVFKKLIFEEDMMLQEFQYNIYEKGELAFMIFDGKFSHAILKKAKKGEFKVQDDFGGSVYEYTASSNEIKFAEEVVSACNPKPIYARVDIIFDNNNKPAVGELEMIEPELWFRFYPPAADLFANAISKIL
ncbi:MAG: hypothetical protein L3J35_00530 [Bacteroidales bacterium]|nr:hypothetical protein [Bacteroidales bacterium]